MPVMPPPPLLHISPLQYSTVVVLYSSFARSAYQWLDPRLTKLPDRRMKFSASTAMLSRLHLQRFGRFGPAEAACVASLRLCPSPLRFISMLTLLTLRLCH